MDSFTYKVRTVCGNSATNTVTITVGDDDGKSRCSPLNCTNSFSYTIVDNPTNGTLSGTGTNRTTINLTASCRSDRIVLNWSLDSIVQQMEQMSPPLTIYDFQIYRSTTTGGTYTLIGNASGTANYYGNSTVNPNTIYYYVVTFRYQDPNTRHV